MTRRIRFLLSGALAATVSLLACNETPVDLPTPTTIVVSPTQLTMFVNDFTLASAHVLDQRGQVIENAFPTWTSDNPSVAVVFTEIPGTAEVVAQTAGTATLTAAYGSLSATVAVTVNVRQNEDFLVASLNILADTVRTDVNTVQNPQVDFRAFDARGSDRCQNPPTTLFQSDQNVATGNLVFGTSCRIQINPQGAGSTWLVVTMHNAKDSVFVIVSSLTFDARFTRLPHDTLVVAGTTQSYEVTVTDNADQAVQGVTLNFDVEGGALSSAVATTDASGMATVDWRYPQQLPNSPGASFFEISFEATYTPAGYDGPVDVGGDDEDEDVRPGPATRVVFLADFDDDGTEDTLGTAANVQLGFFPDLFAQSFDEYGNHRMTNVIFSAADLSVIGPKFDDGTREGVTLNSETLRTETITASEGTGSASVAITWTAGPPIVWSQGDDEVWIGQNEDIGNPPAPGDTMVFDGSDPSAYPVFTLRSDTLAFVWFNTGNWDVALVRSGGQDAAAPISTLPADNRASDQWGFPVFRTQANNPAGSLVFISDRDADKVLAADDQWDVYLLDRSTGTVTKVTNTSPDSAHIRYRGLSLSSDGSSVLVVTDFVDALVSPDGEPRFSQVYEVTLSTGAITALTSNSDRFTEFRYASYAPSGTKIYIDRFHLFDGCQLVEKDGTTFRVLKQATCDVDGLQPNFHPSDPNTLAYRDIDIDGVRRFRLDQAINVGTAGDQRGRDNVVVFFSWSRR